jgi:O-antigen/teichoic acid export membrane protein
VGPSTPTRSQVLSGVSWAAVSHVVSQAMWWVSLLLLATVVAPAAFGTVALGLTLVATIGVVMEAGAAGSLIASRHTPAGVVWRTLQLNLAIGVVLTVLMAAFARPIVDAFAAGGDAAVLRVLSLGIFFNALSIVPVALLEKALQFRRLAVRNIGSSAVGASGGVAAGVLGAGVWALVLRQLLSQLVLVVAAWLASRGLLPPRERSAGAPRRPPNASWFLLLAAATLLSLNADNLIVGSQTDARSLGLYTFAFTLGFAPLTQMSWVVGRVLFPAAAASDLETVGRRTVRATRLAALALLPIVPPAIVLAPVLLPMLSARWEPTVPVFQLLLVAGVLHGLVNVVGESLAGVGQIRWRSIVTAFATLGLVVAVFVFARLGGIKGAALGHVLFVLPLVAIFATEGMRRVGSGWTELWRELRGVVIIAAAETAVVAGVGFALHRQGETVAAVVAAVAGVLVVVVGVFAGPTRQIDAVLPRLRARVAR